MEMDVLWTRAPINTYSEHKDHASILYCPIYKIFIEGNLWFHCIQCILCDFTLAGAKRLCTIHGTYFLFTI